MLLSKELLVKPVHIGIVGARARNDERDYEQVELAFFGALRIFELGIGEVIIVSGGARRGGDRFAKRIAKTYNVSYLEFAPAPSSTELEFIKNAYTRNTYIADASYLLIACMSIQPTSGGTQDTVRKFLKKNPAERFFRV